MDSFDVNLLSQVKALNQKMSISQEQLHLKRKVMNEEKGKGRNAGKRFPKGVCAMNSEYPMGYKEEEREGCIDITI